MTPRRRYALDVLERTAKTFVQGFLGIVTLDSLTSRVDLSLREQLASGALAGAYAVLTSFASKPVGAADSASLLPAHIDPPQEAP